MLTVYRASAGSGKTHQLTEEYLKLLFSGSNSYRHILAVTFTNKATDEMKKRIIQELDVLSQGGKSDYLETLKREFELSDEAVYQRAHRILLSILHDYSSFNISTIDRFFQQTMRAFAREIGLQGGYNVELDTGRILTEAVDKMIFSLEDPANKEILSWLLRFSEEKIENGKSWNFKKEVIDLGTELFKEKYKQMSGAIRDKLQDKGELKKYIQQLSQLAAKFEATAKGLGNAGIVAMEKNGFTADDFSGGARSPLRFFHTLAKGEMKQPSSAFQKLADDIDQWKAAAKSRQYDGAIKSSYENGLNECVKQVLGHFAGYPLYNSALIIRKHIYTLGILNDIDNKIKELAAEDNLMLLADTTHLLNRIIDDTDTPFIYEKIGVKIDHYMIDEFQDTSVMQWQNFSPLIHESLAQKDHSANKLSNLIVGDVKQSIYRWRSSDWKLLDQQLGREFSGQMHDKVLGTNWRSCPAIVGFNNAFFTVASRALQLKFNDEVPDLLKEDQRLVPYLTKICEAYKDVYQEIPEKKKDQQGHVRFNFIDTSENKEWKDEVLIRLPKVIEAWQDKGYSLRDMAVLVRTKDEGCSVAERLLQYKQEQQNPKYRFDVISDEALYVKNAPVVKLILAILNYLRKPNDLNLKRMALMEYAIWMNPEEEAADDFFKNNGVETDFPQEVKAEIKEIAGLPLYEMCERLVALFIQSGNDSDNVFLQAFQDMVLDFSGRKSADLIAFLDWWQESGVKKTISTPESQDAIRIMTIHKSKGLGFKAVLIPFCDWDIDQKPNNILWCEPMVSPFDEIPLLPIPYNKSLADSIFAFEYFEEKIHSYIDNLNVAYVAFTRAKEELVAFSPKSEKEVTNRLGGLLHFSINKSSDFMMESDSEREFVTLSSNYFDEKLAYEDGEEWKPQIKQELKPGEQKMANYRSVNPDGRLQLRLRNREFFAGSDERRYGNLMHDILSRIVVVEDVEKAVQELVFSGEITAEKGNGISAHLCSLLENPEIAPWFSSEVKVKNEMQILQSDGAFFRPDRVVFSGDQVIVIDFKFGARKEKKYHMQVTRYISLIRQMGYLEVKGFLWYVELGEVEEV